MSNPRTCVACRQRGPRAELVRLVLSPEGALVVDPKGRLPGRGAWVHPTRECAGRLEEHAGMLRRTLKAEADTSGLVEDLRQLTLRGVLDALSLASAAGALVGGRDVLEAAIVAGRVIEVVVASDASERTVRELRAVAGEQIPFVTIPLDRESLGARVGRGSRAALGVTRSRATSYLLRQLRRLRDLG